MMQQFITWLGKRLFPADVESEPHYKVPGVRVRPSSESLDHQAAKPPSDLNFEPEISGRIEDAGPGKNVYVRSKYVREQSGTHDVLKIVDESLLADDGDDGIDPYNTGRFDRSKTWSSHYRK